MPKDPRKNIQNYKIDGGHLNEYEFKQAQGEMAEESEYPFGAAGNEPDAGDFPNQSRGGEKSQASATRRSSGQADAAGTDKSEKTPAKKAAKKASKAASRQPAKSAKKGGKKSSAAKGAARKSTQKARKR